MCGAKQGLKQIELVQVKPGSCHCPSRSYNQPCYRPCSRGAMHAVKVWQRTMLCSPAWQTFWKVTSTQALSYSVTTSKSALVESAGRCTFSAVSRGRGVGVLYSSRSDEEVEYCRSCLFDVKAFVWYFCYILSFERVSAFLPSIYISYKYMICRKTTQMSTFPDQCD